MSNVEKLDKAMGPGQAGAADLAWHSPKQAPFHVAGLGWFEREGLYRRLPRQPRWPIRGAVDSLANCTAGAQIRFCTDSRRIAVRVKLRGPGGMIHMPATGQCGFDLYLETPAGLRYCSTAKWPFKDAAYEVTLFDGTPAGMRYAVLNFPLYQGVEEVSVGLDAAAAVERPRDWAWDRRVIVYGTSITQGGCAARPGMAYTNILSRRLNVEFINLGFSGNGKGEPELARLIAEIERPGCYVLDYEANAGEGVRTTLEPFIAILREAQPEAPIVVVSRPKSAREQFSEQALSERLARRDFQRETVEKLAAAGDKRISFVDGGDLLGGEDWYETTVDGSHATDLGFMRMADGLESAIRSATGI